MADAKRDEERGLASAQLEAFHQTFNFCMDCRQYTCTDCWNQAEGRCLSCAPMPGQLEARGCAAAHAAAQPADGDERHPTRHGLADDRPDRRGATDRLAQRAEHRVAAATPYIPTDLRPVELPDDDIEMMVGAADAAAELDAIARCRRRRRRRSRPSRRPRSTGGRAPSRRSRRQPRAVRQSPTPTRPARPSAISNPSSPRAEPEPAVAAEPEPSPSRSPRPPSLEPEPVAAAAEPEPVAEPAPVEPVTRTPTPGWTIVAPGRAEDRCATRSCGLAAAEPASTSRRPPAQPPRQPTPGQPGQPSWPTVPPAAFSVPAAQAVWEESSLSVISRPGSGVQACVSCGLPLSATARFCRRCGSRQG